MKASSSAYLCVKKQQSFIYHSNKCFQNTRRLHMNVISTAALRVIHKHFSISFEMYIWQFVCVYYTQSRKDCVGPFLFNADLS